MKAGAVVQAVRDIRWVDMVHSGEYSLDEFCRIVVQAGTVGTVVREHRPGLVEVNFPGDASNHLLFVDSDVVELFEEKPPYPSFRATTGRAPIAGKDYHPDNTMCQDDYEYYTGTGQYSDNVRPALTQAELQNIHDHELDIVRHPDDPRW